MSSSTTEHTRIIPSSMTMKFILFCSLYFFFNCGEVKAEEEWGYGARNGPDKWCKILEHTHCCKDNQSPINIVTHTAKLMEHKLVLKNYKQSHSGVTLTCNGHTVVVKLNKLNPVPHLCVEHNEFELDSLHFHWGLHDDKGSEHRIDGKAASLEMHIVHVNKKYGTVKEAGKDPHDPDALAVVAVLFEVSKEGHSEHYNKLFSDIAHVVHEQNVEHSFHNDKNMRLEDFLPPQDELMAYKYKGSLTTPDCSPNVNWFVVAKKMKVKAEQLAELRMLATKHGSLVSNRRPIQELKGRDIHKLHVEIAS